MELSSEQRQRFREVFEACNEFDSNDQLRDLMAVSTLKPFRSDVEAGTKAERITRCIARLSDKTWKGGEVFLYFVDELRQQYREGDGRRQSLDRLYLELHTPLGNTNVASSSSGGPLPASSNISQEPGRNIIKIFYSHATSSRDQDMFQEFLKQMSFLKATGRIKEWHQALLLPGTPIEDERKRQLQGADIVVVMLSPDYVSNPLLLNESEQALVSGVSVVPVLLRPVHWRTLKIGHLTPLPRNEVPISRSSDRDSAFIDVANELYGMVEQLLSSR